MLKGILGILLFIVIFVVLVLAILFHKTLRNFRAILEQQSLARAQRKAEQEEEYFRRTSQKYYKAEERPQFDKDYFKGTESDEPKQKQPKQKTARRTTTSSGVTIIDHRDEADRKIFDEGEGDYVDFVEVKN